MSMVKDLMNNEELVRSITEDLEDFDENTPVTYEVWTMGYNNNGSITDTEMLVSIFTDPDEAVKCAANLTLADIVHQASIEDDNKEMLVDISYISVEVETVVEDDNSCGMNIGTIYKKTIYLEEESEEEIVSLGEKDYVLFEDGSIQVSRELLGQYNKNDQVKIMFKDEDCKPVLTYKIISKTTANNYICEFVY
jgi:hypothetical protein